MISDCLLLLDSIIMACDCLVLVSVGLVYLEGDVIGPIVAHPKPSYINKVNKGKQERDGDAHALRHLPLLLLDHQHHIFPHIPWRAGYKWDSSWVRDIS